MKLAVAVPVLLLLAACSGSATKFDLDCTQVIPVGVAHPVNVGTLHFRLDLEGMRYCAEGCTSLTPLAHVDDEEITTFAHEPFFQTFKRRDGRLIMKLPGLAQTLVFDCKKQRFSGFPKQAF